MKKGIALALLCVLCLCNSSTVLEAKGNDLTKDSHACVSWATYYDSYEEMSEDSEAIVVGKVTASSTYFDPSVIYNWEKVACHEMGHYIGLAHNTTSVSTMHPSHNSQPGYPQYPDILALSEIYS